MLRVTERIETPEQPEVTLTLPFELRVKSRMPVQLDNGENVGLMLPRGTQLRDGDLLRDESGRVIRVCAAPEIVSTARSRDPLLLARACYHLGNRHVALQIETAWVRYATDHVLDDMLCELGLEVVNEIAPFEPEGGAYGGGHGHAHNHDYVHVRLV
jgi:urease accessory protein